MQTTCADLRGHDLLLPETRRLAEANIDLYRRHRRFLRFIDTRQKWLLLHLVAVTSGGGDRLPGRGAAANWICERADELGIASRNTVLAFFNQLAAYGYLRKQDCGADRRIKLISLSEATEAVLIDWTATLVGIANGEDTSAIERESLRRIYLETASALLANPKWLRAPLDIRLTQDMRGGWLVMSEILRHLPRDMRGGDWLAAEGLGIPAMTTSFGLSRSTLYRLVRLSIEAGIMTWQDIRGASTLALSHYHLRQYERWTGRLLETVASARESVIPGLVRPPAEPVRPCFDMVPSNRPAIDRSFEFQL